MLVDTKRLEGALSQLQVRLRAERAANVLLVGNQWYCEQDLLEFFQNHVLPKVQACNNPDEKNLWMEFLEIAIPVLENPSDDIAQQKSRIQFEAFLGKHKILSPYQQEMMRELDPLDLFSNRIMHSNARYNICIFLCALTVFLIPVAIAWQKGKVATQKLRDEMQKEWADCKNLAPSKASIVFFETLFKPNKEYNESLRCWTKPGSVVENIVERRAQQPVDAAQSSSGDVELVDAQRELYKELWSLISSDKWPKHRSMSSLWVASSPPRGIQLMEEILLEVGMPLSRQSSKPLYPGQVTTFLNIISLIAEAQAPKNSKTRKLETQNFYTICKDVRGSMKTVEGVRDLMDRINSLKKMCHPLVEASKRKSPRM